MKIIQIKEFAFNAEKITYIRLGYHYQRSLFEVLVKFDWMDAEEDPHVFFGSKDEEEAKKAFADVLLHLQGSRC